MEKRRTFDYPNPQMGLVLQHFYEEHPEVIDRAGHEFFEYVQAVQGRVPKEKIEQLFNEWFAYDFHLKTDKSTIETYIFRNPDDLSAEELDLMQQANDHNFTGYFWIKDVDAETQVLTLLELSTEKLYEVRDVTASQSIAGGAGLIASRLIQINGDWYFASDPIWFMPMPLAGKDGLNFIDAVRHHFGVAEPPIDNPADD